MDGICKTAVFGKYPDAGARNRSVSRKGALQPYNASIAEGLLLTSSYRKGELQEIIDIRNTGIQPTLSHATYYWHSEHFSFQRPNWFASVRMYSTRTHNMEQPYNSEGLLNHHRGDGANHLSLSGEEYLDIWPVYDYQKIPGATILQKEEMPPPNQIQKLGSMAFVGAATDGKYGAVGFDFRSPHDPLIARKAWFFFDEAYVCLGSGISCKNRELPVHTTLNQSHLRGEIHFASEGNSEILKKGTHIEKELDWVFHDSVGYMFPQSTQVHMSNEKAAGSWWRINKQTDSPKEAIELDLFTLWLDHGPRPSEAAYAYTVIPATTLETVKEKAINSPTSILVNSPEIQAVAHVDLDMQQAVFYQAGEIQLSNGLSLMAYAPCIVMYQKLPNDKTRLTVSDPNRELGSIHLSLSERIETQGEHYLFHWNEQKQVSELLIDLPTGQYAGSSRVIEW